MTDLFLSAWKTMFTRGTEKDYDIVVVSDNGVKRYYNSIDKPFAGSIADVVTRLCIIAPVKDGVRTMSADWSAALRNVPITVIPMVDSDKAEVEDYMTLKTVVKKKGVVQKYDLRNKDAASLYVDFMANLIANALDGDSEYATFVLDDKEQGVDDIDVAGYSYRGQVFIWIGQGAGEASLRRIGLWSD